MFFKRVIYFNIVQTYSFVEILRRNQMVYKFIKCVQYFTVIIIGVFDYFDFQLPREIDTQENPFKPSAYFDPVKLETADSHACSPI